jgi:hypothetical protein
MLFFRFAGVMPNKHCIGGKTAATLSRIPVRGITGRATVKLTNFC